MEQFLDEENIERILYGKPKKNYRLGFEYKLNTRLKPIDDIFYPLYIEVRYKGKMNFFPSRITLKFSENSFDEFRKEYMGQIFLKQETHRILASVGNYFNSESTTSVTQWYSYYSKELESSILLPFIENLCYQKLKEAISKRPNNNEFYQNIETSLDKIHTQEGSKSNIFELIQLLSFFGLNDFSHLHELLVLAKEIPTYIKLMPFKAETRGEMTNFVTIQDIMDGSYVNALLDIQLVRNKISSSVHSEVNNHVKTVGNFGLKLSKLI